jgi:hypothetical protein
VKFDVSRSFRFRKTKRRLGCAVCVITCRIMGGRCLTVSYDIANSVRGGPVVDLSGTLMCLSGPPMALRCREMRSASPDVRFVSVTMSHGDTFFGDEMARGEVGAEASQLFRASFGAEARKLITTAVITRGDERIRTLVGQPHLLVATSRIRFLSHEHQTSTCY